jgi:hypothetical protein
MPASVFLVLPALRVLRPIVSGSISPWLFFVLLWMVVAATAVLLSVLEAA